MIGVILMTTHIAASPALAVTSTAFNDGAEIPAQYTCEGKNDEQSWPIAIANVPANAKSLAVIVHDPDAPDPKAPRPEGWTHFIVYNLPAYTTTVTSGVAAAELPKGALFGKNDWGKSGFKGPCPPIGKHRYVTTVFALDGMLDVKNPDRAALLKAVEGHVVAKGELTGTYQKKK
jgi:Raf kinase inhibitor-like YbhB/YbcL family protein